MSDKGWISLGAVCAALVVMMGAFGAHWLGPRIPQWYPDDIALQTKRLADWETAARYQMYHALGLVALGAVMGERASRKFQVVGWLFTGGILLFSGSLYILVITTHKAWGAVTPLGGTMMILGWVVFAWAAWSERKG